MTVLKILNRAKAEIGVRETGVNHVKYVDDYLGTTSYDGSCWPWCVIFLWWIFDNTWLFPHIAHCDAVRSYAQQQGCWVTSGFKPGDCVIFDWTGDNSGDHIGLVEAVDGNRLQLIEGNCGDKVTELWRTASNILGAYRPPYESAPEEDNTNAGPEEENAPAAADLPAARVSIEVPMLLDGSVGYPVKALQALLIMNGISCGYCGIDGEFGPDTERAVELFQASAELSRDGIVGAETWQKLIGG